jgi:ABC-type branched-subunit amino acid transport system substrate-binding protein
LCQGASLAISNLNAASTNRTRLIIRGRPGQWGTDGDEAAVLALDDQVDAIITSSDGALTHQALQVAGRTQVPIVTLCGDASVTLTGVPWAVRLVPSTVDEACCIFRSTSGRAAKTWAAFIPGERAGRETARDLHRAAVACGIDIHDFFIVAETATDLNPLVKELLTTSSDGILLWINGGQAGEMARLLRDARYTGLLAGPARLRSAGFTNAAGPSADRVLVPWPSLAAEAAVAQKDFRIAYARQYDTEPDFLAAMAYDAVHLLATRRSDAGARSSLATNIASGLFGPVQFDPSGNRVIPLAARFCTQDVGH